MVLEEMLPELPKEISLPLRITMWFQNERAVAYLARQVQNISQQLTKSAG
jgi:hypothetical protein